MEVTDGSPYGASAQRASPQDVLTGTRSTFRPDQMLSRFDTKKQVSVNMSPPSSSASNQSQKSLAVIPTQSSGLYIIHGAKLCLLTTDVA